MTARLPSAASGSGRTVRTVNRRMARTARLADHPRCTRPLSAADAGSRKTTPGPRRVRSGDRKCGAMVGRIPVMDVIPRRRPGRQPAKATVGEPFPSPPPCSARATTSSRRGRAADPGRRRAPVRMVRATPRCPTATTRPGHARRRGRVDLRGPGLVRPVATWQHDAGIKIPAGVDVELMFTEGALLLERVRRRCSTTDERPSSRRHRRGPATPAPGRGPARRRCRRRGRAVLRAHPLRELVTVDRALPGSGSTAPRALFGSWYEFFPRSEGATRDPKTGKVTSGTFRTAAKRLDAVPRWASTSSTCRRSTRSARSTARAPTTPSPRARRHRLAVGDRQQGRRPRRDPPRPRHLRRLRRLRRPGPRARPRGRLDLALQARPTTPG